MRTAAILVCVCLLSPASAEAADIEEHYANGAVRRIYRLDSKKRITGPYQEFHPSGAKRVVAKYRAGLKHGPFTEWSERGDVLRSGTYVEDRFSGVERIFEDTKLVNEKRWADDVCIHPRSAAAIRTEIERIMRRNVNAYGHRSASTAFKHWQAYRYLAGVPYKGAALDEKLTEHTQAAVKLFQRLKQPTTEPSNPGLSDADFKVAKLGAEASVVWRHRRMGREAREPSVGWLSEVVDTFMFHLRGDSSAGPRIRLLNPRLSKTAFGLTSDGYTAMWVREKEFYSKLDWQSFRYPAHGLIPIAYVRPDMVYSLALNHEHFVPPKLEDLSIGVYRVPAKRVDFRKVERSKSLAIGRPRVAQRRLMATYLSIVAFQPAGIKVKKGNRYWVVVVGIRKKDGAAADFRWLVEFF